MNDKISGKTPERRRVATWIRWTKSALVLGLALAGFQAGGGQDQVGEAVATGLFSLVLGHALLFVAPRLILTRKSHGVGFGLTLFFLPEILILLAMLIGLGLTLLCLPEILTLLARLLL